MSILRLATIALFFPVFQSLGQVKSGYKPTYSTYFVPGDSIRVDAWFVFDKLQVDTANQPVKESNALWLRDFLKKNPLVKVSINMHTDTKGSVARNLSASQKRAVSFTNWLISEGVPRQQFRSEGWGEHKPIYAEREIAQTFRIDRNRADSLDKQNDRITVIIEEVQQQVLCDYRPAGTMDYLPYYKSTHGIIGVDTRYCLEFIPADSALYGQEFKARKAEFDSLVKFIRCNPSVKFVLGVHTSFAHRDKAHEATQIRANQIVRILARDFGVSEDQLEPIGFGVSQPIVPEMVLNELYDEPEKQQRLDAINSRVELIISEIGAASE